MKVKKILRMASVMLCAIALSGSLSVRAASPDVQIKSQGETKQTDDLQYANEVDCTLSENELYAEKAVGDNAYPAKSKGSFNIRAAYQGGSKNGLYDAYTIKLENIDMTKNINSLRSVRATAVYTGNASGSLISGMAHTATSEYAGLYRDKGKSTFALNYSYLQTNFQLHIPTGYRIGQVQYTGQGSRGTLYHLYLNNANLEINTTNGVKTWNSAKANQLTAACSADGQTRMIKVKSMVDIFYHAGVGTTSATSANAHGKVTQNVIITPIQYTLQYNLNGGENGPQSSTVTYDTPFSLPDMVPQRAGYRFGGWNIGGIVYSSGQTLTAQQVNSLASSQGASVSATAVWTPITYFVSYDLNGGMGLGAQQTVTYDLNFSLAAAPAKEGYCFAGWKSNKNGQIYEAGSLLPAASFSSTQGDTVIFQAVWNSGSYQVAYYMTDEEDGLEPLEIRPYQIDQSARLMEAPDREGWVFTGWKIDGATYSAAQSVKNLTKKNGETLRAYAKWQPIQYSISYDGNGATEGTTANQDSLAYGSTYRLQPNGYVRQFKITYDLDEGTIEQPVNCVSSVFRGWSRNPSSSQSEETGKGEGASEDVLLENNAYVQNLTSRSETITLYAIWDDAPLTIVLPTPVRAAKSSLAKNEMGEEGYLVKTYEFVGWTGKDDSTGTILSQTQTITKDMSLTAVWKETTTFSKQADGSDSAGQIMNKLDEIKEKLANGYDLTDEQAQYILDAIEKGSAFMLKIGNVEYTIVRNEDGTLAIRVASLPTDTQKVTIPSEVKIGTHVYPITEIAKECFKDNKRIKEVKIDYNITKIGERAFSGCTSLQKVTLSEGLVSIGNRAFEGCKSLTQIKLPMSLQTIGDYAFWKCTKLKTLKMKKGLLTIGNYSFQKCISLTSVRIPDTVLKIGKYSFASCTKLRSVITSKSCTTMGEGVFSGCRALKKLVLKDALTEMPVKACMGCKKLETITIPKKIMSIRTKAFYNCVRLKNVKIKSNYLSKVEKEAFKRCSKKIQFTVPAKKKSAYANLLKGKY